jgi:hypothetical protein
MIEEIKTNNHTTLILNDANLHSLGHWCTAIDNIIKRSHKEVSSLRFSHIAEKTVRLDIYTKDKDSARDINSRNTEM